VQQLRQLLFSRGTRIALRRAPTARDARAVGDSAAWRGGAAHGELEDSAMSYARKGFTIAASVTALSAATPALALDIPAGDWTFTFTGNVNAHYILSECDDTPVAVQGGLSCIAIGQASNPSSAVSNGLLPASLGLQAATTQNGYDIKAVFGLYPGISTNDGGSPNLQNTNPAVSPNTGLGTTGLDVRQVYLTFGNDSMGTVLAGRNIGLFQGDAILGDMTIHGVGAGNGNYAAPANTSLGSIGLGYIYPDWIAQIDYTTPDFYGAKLTVGIFDPLNTLGPASTTKGGPGVQGKLSWTSADKSIYLSASALHQRQEGALTNATSFDSTAYDVGGKYTWGPIGLMMYWYEGWGVGTTALFFNASDGLGNERNSHGFLAQATYTISGETIGRMLGGGRVGDTMIGVNYGESNLSLAQGEINPTLVRRNSKVTAGLYHHLTKNLTLLGEMTAIEAENQAGFTNDSKTFNVGAFLEF
jgi:hypothetical protein